MRARRALPLIAAAGMLLLLAIGLWLSAGRWAQGRADATADAAAARTARSHAGLLSSELQKFRLLPLVLVEYPDVAAALDGDAAARPRLNRTLALLAGRTDAAAIYAIDRQGNTSAASNWDKSDSFVGQNYGFRPYFRDALAHGASELFALGTVSGRPGMYLARRVESGGRALGVVVVKVEFDRIEAIWAHAAGATLVTDPHGVILVTSQPAWRFRTTHPLDPATMAQARHTLQFGSAPLMVAPVSLDQPTPMIGGERYRRASVPIALAGATLFYLEPLAPALAAAKTSVRLWGLIALCAFALIVGIATRARERQALQRRAQSALEREVERRTAELREANAQLVVESRERAAADLRFREARENLTQANRLGSLGQITAGVAHEINQPVAAIRTFAENAELFLERGTPQGTRDSLAQIVALTARIGTITNELRGFARKRTPEAGPVALGAVIDGALLLAGDRVRELVHVTLPSPSPVVFGDRVRLEQVLLNLLQNAAEALGKTPGARIEITIHPGDPVTILVADNGPGLAPHVADDAFTPFVTGKTQGLGLGLGIARDIVRELGGDIAIVPSPLGGAAFEVRLKPA